MSLEEYVTLYCGEEEEGEEITFRQFSEELGEYIKLLEPVIPPQEIAAWHEILLTTARALKTAIEDHPESKDELVSDRFIIDVMLPLMLQYQSELIDTLTAMDPAVRERLLAAGCIDEELAAAISDIWWDEGRGEI